jgi:hypothetical protein
VAAIERKGHLPAGKSRPSPLLNERAAAGAASDFQPIAAQSWLAGTTAAGGGVAAGGGGGGRGAGGGGSGTGGGGPAAACTPTLACRPAACMHSLACHSAARPLLT